MLNLGILHYVFSHQITKVPFHQNSLNYKNTPVLLLVTMYNLCFSFAMRGEDVQFVVECCEQFELDLSLFVVFFSFNTICYFVRIVIPSHFSSPIQGYESLLF